MAHYLSTGSASDLAEIKSIGPSVLPALLAAYQPTEETLLAVGHFFLIDAVEALGSRSVPYLVTALQQPHLVAAAAYASVGLEHSAAVELLPDMERAYSKAGATHTSKVAALWAMGAIGDRSVKAFLLREKASSDERIAWKAAEALEWMEMGATTRETLGVPPR